MTTARQAVRWAIRSGGGLVANLALLTLWVDGLGIPAWLAIVPNWVILSTVGYVVTDRWVFAELGGTSGLLGHARQFVGSESIMLGAKAVNYIIYVSLLSVIDYRVAWVVGAVVSFGLTFAGNRWWWQRSDHSTSI